MGHGLHEFTRRNGGNKMQIDFTAGVRRPKDYIQSAKLSSEVGIHIRAKMPLATHWTQYKKDETLTHVIPHAINTVAVSPVQSMFNLIIMLHDQLSKNLLINASLFCRESLIWTEMMRWPKMCALICCKLVFGSSDIGLRRSIGPKLKISQWSKHIWRSQIM